MQHGHTIGSSLKATGVEPTGNPSGYVLQESSASFDGGVHGSCADRCSWSVEEAGCAMDEGNLSWQTRRRRWPGATHSTVTGRTVRRLAGHLRIQPDLVGKLRNRVQDLALSHAELLKVLPASVPVRLAGETCLQPNLPHFSRAWRVHSMREQRT